MKKHHTVKKDSTSHESISEDLSGQDRDDIMQNKDTVPQNATGDARLKELLHVLFNSIAIMEVRSLHTKV